MRTLNSAKNMTANLGITIIMTLLGFFTRKIFVDSVGVEYLGLNGLLQNILGVMTLLEGGFAASVVYNLYKPLAEDNRPKIIALIQLYKKVYRYIAFGIFVFALCLYPFLGNFIKDGEGLEYVSIVYFLFLFNSIAGYFTAYKWSIINASQQIYKLAPINLAYQIGLSLSKLAILYFTGNYILFLVVESLFCIGLNLGIISKANQLFPYINTKKKYTIDDKTKVRLIDNIKSLFINNVGTYFMHGTDNIVISSFVGVVSIGLYSNYTLITQTISGLVSQILNSISESVGNLIASEDIEKVYSVFKTAFFINFLLAAIPVNIMYNTIRPFIAWWLGEEYLLSHITLCIILINFYITTIRTTAITFKIKAGLFKYDRFTTLLQGLINVILSILFVQYWELAGVLFATTISILSIGFWQYPRICYKYIFKKPLKLYFIRLSSYSLIWIITLILSTLICRLITFENQLVTTITYGIITLIVTLSIFVLYFKHTQEWKNVLLRIRIVLNTKI